jgi:hypothetical protein
MVTGEKAGLWGDITNTNLDILTTSNCWITTTLAVNSTTTGAALAFTNAVQYQTEKMHGYRH